MIFLFDLNTCDRYATISFYNCSDSKLVVHGLFKIMQNFVNNKINNYKLLVS